MKCWFASLTLCAALTTTQALAFSMYEHKEIGDRGFATAWQQFRTLAASVGETWAKQRNVRVAKGGAEPAVKVAALAEGKAFAWFSMGDLVALYGDWAGGYEELNDAKAVARAPIWRRMLDEGAEVATDSENARMMELAAVNTTHFAGTALDTYLKWHRLALEHAAKPGGLAEALHYEALALHSYTDLFAAGHMLEERALTERLLQWAKAKGSWLLKPLKKLGPIVLSKVWGLWANFYHNAFNTLGARVTNLDGESWRAYGDDKYRVVSAACGKKSRAAQRLCEDPTTREQRAILDAGVARSVLAVLKTAAGRKLERGEAFSSLRKLPVGYAETRRPRAPSEQKLRILRMLAKLGKAFIKRGFDFTLGILQYEKKEYVGHVSYAEKVKANAAADR